MLKSMVPDREPIGTRLSPNTAPLAYVLERVPDDLFVPVPDRLTVECIELGAAPGELERGRRAAVADILDELMHEFADLAPEEADRWTS